LDLTDTASNEEEVSLEATSISHFVILRDLGEGGAARVVLARHAASDRLLAIKTSARSRDGAAERAEAEAVTLKLVAALRSPFLPRMLGAFEDEEHAYLVLVSAFPFFPFSSQS
jgi:serine/threonine protein kinase